MENPIPGWNPDLATQLRVPRSLWGYEHIIRDEPPPSLPQIRLGFVVFGGGGRRPAGVDYIEGNPILWNDDEENPRNIKSLQVL